MSQEQRLLDKDREPGKSYCEVQRQPKELIGTDPSVSDFVSTPRMSVGMSHTEKKGFWVILKTE